jgi:hypothetical protein
MRVRACALAVTLALCACSTQNPNERLAQNVTEALVANDLRPVQNDIAPNPRITRVQVAEWSDELNDQGKLESVKEITCPPGLEVGAHCFIATFEKRTFNEIMRLDEHNKIVVFRFKAADSGGASPAQ